MRRGGGGRMMENGSSVELGICSPGATRWRVNNESLRKEAHAMRFCDGTI
uniref:Uncharacterized protein n=1 Tax=Arundo donax TaxID=35708 RepID=A0A0A9FY98_ARUDO